jgi:hypothetical protein
MDLLPTATHSAVMKLYFKFHSPVIAPRGKDLRCSLGELSEPQTRSRQENTQFHGGDYEKCQQLVASKLLLTANDVSGSPILATLITEVMFPETSALQRATRCHIPWDCNLPVCPVRTEAVPSASQTLGHLSSRKPFQEI